MPKETGPFVSELALKKAAEEALHAEFEEVTAAQKAEIDTALTAETPAEEAKDVGGVSTNKGEKLPESPEPTFMRDLKEWYGIFFKSHTSLFEFSKYCAKMFSYIEKTTKNLSNKPDKTEKPITGLNEIVITATASENKDPVEALDKKSPNKLK